jgi:DUF4097 and DUF4098 domain-containing protein YvlB
MRSLIKGLIIFLVLMVCGLTTLLIVGINYGNSFFDFFSGAFELELVDTSKYLIDETGNIVLTCNSEDVTLKRAEGGTDKFIIKQYVGSYAAKGQFLEVFNTFSGDENSYGLKINADKRKGRSIMVLGSNARRCEVYVPESYRGNWKIVSSSGDVTIDSDLKCENITINTASGDVELDELAAKDILIETTSGDISGRALHGEGILRTKNGSIKIDEISGDSLFETGSGDVKLDDIKGQIKIDTQSGDVEAKEIEGGVQVATSSGSVDLLVDKLKSDVDIDTEDGDIVCKFPYNAGFQIEAETGSGDIKCDFKKELGLDEDSRYLRGDVDQGGNYEVEISTSSGDIEIID